MKLLFAIILTLTTISMSIAQQSYLKGKVTDAHNQEELIGANILILEGGGAAADFNGDYKIALDPGTYHVVYKFVGYTTEEREILIRKGEDLILDIELAEGNQLNDVVVSASKFEQKLGEVPVSMNVIKSDMVNNKAVTNPSAIIDQVPGVQILENQVSIRGGSGFSYGSGSRVLLMVDDLPMLSADVGDIKWNSLPIENLEQIEVIKGASSVLYGSSALNGIINIRTGYPRSKPKTVINISNGIYLSPSGTQKGVALDGGDSTIHRGVQKWNENTNHYISGNFYHSRKVTEYFDMVIGGNFLTDDGYRAGADEHRARINTNLRWRSKKIDGLSYGINGNHNNNKQNLFFLWQNADSVFYPQGLLDTATTTLSQTRTYRTNIDPFVSYYDSSGNKHSLRTRYYNTVNKNNKNQESTANLFYAEYQFQKHWKKDLTGTFGLMNNYSTIVAELYGNHTANNSAAFMQLNKKYKKFTVTGGARLETFRMDTVKMVVKSKLLKTQLPFKPVFRFGTTYELTKVTFLRGSYGEGFRFPSIAEKFIKTQVGGLNIFPNPSVGPETGWSAELGIKQGFKIGKFIGFIDLAGFYTGYENMMEFTFGTYHDNGTPWVYDPNATDNPGLSSFGAQSKNVENATIKGGEISVMGQGKIKEINISILAGYTYIDPQRDANADSLYIRTFSDSTSTLKYRSKHLAKLDLQLEYKKVSFGVSSRYNSFRENIDQTFVDPFLGNIFLPGYGDYRNARRTGDIIFDARMGIQISKTAKVAVLLNNALNREYSSRPGNVMPYRTLIFQYSLTF